MCQIMMPCSWRDRGMWAVGHHRPRHNMHILGAAKIEMMAEWNWRVRRRFTLIVMFPQCSCLAFNVRFMFGAHVQERTCAKSNLVLQIWVYWMPGEKWIVREKSRWEAFSSHWITISAIYLDSVAPMLAFRVTKINLFRLHPENRAQPTLLHHQVWWLWDSALIFTLKWANKYRLHSPRNDLAISLYHGAHFEYSVPFEPSPPFTWFQEHSCMFSIIWFHFFSHWIVMSD